MSFLGRIPDTPKWVKKTDAGENCFLIFVGDSYGLTSGDKINTDLKMKTFITILFSVLLLPAAAFCQTKDRLDKFIPEGYKIFETEYGDLNKDGLEDAVLIIKATGEAGFDENQFGDIVDKNRRGILILFNTGNDYELALLNNDCFSSENEDGGVYYAPELWVDVEKGNLYVRYAHGRYGHWWYTFRFQNNDFELIGYDAAEHYGPIVNREISINFSTKRKLVRENVNDFTEESGDEIFEETWFDIFIDKLVKLSEIEDFDRFDEESFNF